MLGGLDIPLLAYFFFWYLGRELLLQHLEQDGP